MSAPDQEARQPPPLTHGIVCDQNYRDARRDLRGPDPTCPPARIAGSGLNRPPAGWQDRQILRLPERATRPASTPPNRLSSVFQSPGGCL
jgi:hypothetical protein